jgi:hypothetical protein
MLKREQATREIKRNTQKSSKISRVSRSLLAFLNFSGGNHTGLIAFYREIYFCSLFKRSRTSDAQGESGSS